MKKYLGLIPALIFVGFVPNAFAAVTFTLAPTSTTSGNEAVIQFTYHSQSSGFMRFYLYDHTGANISGNSNADHADGSSPIGWTTAAFSTGLTPADYSVIGLDSDGIVGGNTDAHCGTGHTVSDCFGAMNGNYLKLNTSTITAAPSSTASSTDLLITSKEDVTYFMQAMTYGLILGLFIGGISKAFKHTKIL